MAAPAVIGIGAGASAIGVYILNRVWGFVTGLLEAEAAERVNEARADGPEAFDNVAGELEALEQAVADYEDAFQSTRLQAHTLISEGPNPETRIVPACKSYKRTPEMQQLQAAAKKLRELDRHSEALAAETVMNMEAELQILQDEMEQSFKFWKDPGRRKEATARYGSETQKLARQRSEGQGHVYAHLAVERKSKMRTTLARARDIDARISDLIGRLDYLVETMRKERDTFVALDERICSHYQAKGN